MAPYLFLFVDEALNIATKRAQLHGSIEGIPLPFDLGHQLTIQYADDTNYTIQGTEANMQRLLDLLELFHLASRLLLNLAKSVAYWFSTRPPPPWLQNFACQWVEPQQLSKLLGTPFGLDLATVDVDEFLLNKIQKKISFWVTTQLSLAGRVVIINSVLLSTLWFFIVIWGGPLEIIKKIKAIFRNFL